MSNASTRRIGLVIAGGLVAGTLDIAYACIYFGIKANVAPGRIFQSVASGLLGNAAYAGGATTEALGLTLHMLICVAMAFAYFLVAKRAPLLVRKPWLLGSAYGLFLYVLMRFAVVPLSAAGGGGGGDALWIALSVVVHMLLVGVPIALFSARALRSSWPRS